MGFINRLKYAFGLGFQNNHFGGLSFFAYKGDECSPPYWIDLNCFDGLTQAYNECSPLNTVVNRNAMALSNAKWWLTDKDDNEVNGYDNIKKLLKSPNPLQTWTEFIIQVDVFRQMYGCVFVLANVASGFSDNKDATSLWAINPKYIDIELRNKLYFQKDIKDIVADYYLSIGGKRTKLDKEHLLYIKDYHQNLNFCPSDIKGVSRIVSLEYPIRNIMQAYEAIYSLNKDRGAQGILSNDRKDSAGAIPLKREEKADIHKELSLYGLSEHQRKIIVTDASLRWQSMSYNVRDLMLFEGIKNNIEQIADTFGYPFELLANQNGVTFSNQDEAKKRHYQDTVIPMAKLYGEKLTSFFGLTDIKIYADYSDVECLKDAEKEKAEALKTKVAALSKAFKDGAITLEEYRIGLDYNETTTGNTFYNENKSEENNQQTNQGTES